MWRPLISIFLISAFILGYSQKNKTLNTDANIDTFRLAEKKYKEANTLYDAAGDDSLLLAKSNSLYREALLLFSRQINEPGTPGTDSLKIRACFYAGIINHNFDSLSEALTYYLRAIALKEKQPQFQDSIIFQPSLFAGSIYFKSGNYDSAIYYYKKAEDIKSNYNNFLEEEQRLYNVLGIIHYETGNLKQAINNIEKAITLMQKSGNKDETLYTNYQLNLASSYIRLEEYQKAQNILEKLISGNSYKEEINQKLGFIAIKQKEFKKALLYFNKIKYTAGKKFIDLCINKSSTYKSLGEIDTSIYYLSLAKSEYYRDKKNNSALLSGLILKAEAELAEESKQYQQAAQLYQNALIKFSNDYTDTSLLSNPKQFSGAFSYIDLFNTLIAKGDVLEKLNTSSSSINYLEASLNSYKSAYKLSTYIEKTYNSDEARLFLNKLKYSNHNKPIDISLKLYELSKKKKFIEDAYYFDQLNKASVLAYGIAENDVKASTTASSILLNEIKKTKTNITRLTLSNSGVDSIKLNKLNENIREQEILLDKLQEELKQQPEWKERKEIEQIPTLPDLQAKIDSKTAVLSYHLTEKEILVFIIGRNKVQYKRISVDSTFVAATSLYKNTLHTVAGGQRYEGAQLAKYLFSKLISPIQSNLTYCDHLVIIPDDELHYLPFESLQDGEERFLLEKFSVQYLYSTSLFFEKKRYSKNSGTLAFAPFSQNSFESNQEYFPRLNASSDEIKNLQGLTLTDTAATKKRFLAEANRYPVVHLASHAIADNENATNSFIAFSPADSNYKLFSSEIYNLRLDSTELIILSACETGDGKLIKGEGLMSLSRAFAYAGCRNIVTSLWRAEDATTAFIMQKLHEYLAKGYTTSRALQAAKLDLFKSDEINPALKTPNYWANIVFIGDYEERRPSSNWVWVAAAIILGGLIYFLYIIKKPR